VPIEEGYYSKEVSKFQTYYNSTRQAELIAASYPKCLKRLFFLAKDILSLAEATDLGSHLDLAPYQ
jgi:hypothetical protein